MAVAAPTVAPLRIKLEARRLHSARRRTRARAPYASISSIMVTGRVSFLVLWGHWNRLKTAPEPGTAAISTRLVLDVCYAGSFVLWRPEDCPPQTPHWPTNPQLMLMMLARPAPQVHEAIPRCTETRWKTQKGLAMKRVGGITATPGKLKL